MQYGMDVVPVAVDGTTLTLSTTASAATAIPNNAAGQRAKLVRVSVTGSAYIKFGTGSGVTATTNSTLINVGDATTFPVAAFDHFSAIADTGTPKINVVPVEY
jgi:hypothetical protein